MIGLPRSYLRDSEGTDHRHERPEQRNRFYTLGVFTGNWSGKARSSISGCPKQARRQSAGPMRRSLSQQSKAIGQRSPYPINSLPVTSRPIVVI
jgi:hypothetical protein